MSSRKPNQTEREALTETPLPMILWLKSKRPDELISLDICASAGCVFTEFLKSSGEKVEATLMSEFPPWFLLAWRFIGETGRWNITASRALVAVEKASLIG